MPRSPKTPCRHQGCRALLDKPGFCDKHRKQAYSQYHQSSENHKENNRFYFRARWRKVRALHLQQEPFCRECRKEGRLVEANIVDHIIPRDHGGSEYEDHNLQTICRNHHSRKSMLERKAISVVD